MRFRKTVIPGIALLLGSMAFADVHDGLFYLNNITLAWEMVPAELTYVVRTGQFFNIPFQAHTGPTHEENQSGFCSNGPFNPRGYEVTDIVAQGTPAGVSFDRGTFVNTGKLWGSVAVRGNYSVTVTAMSEPFTAWCEFIPPDSWVYRERRGDRHALQTTTVRLIVTDLDVDSLEITQAIQENLTPEELNFFVPPAPLSTDDMPVPLVAGKPGLLRIFLKEVAAPIRATVRLWLTPEGVWDWDQYSRSVKLYPGCTPQEARLHLQGDGNRCSSVDFYLGANQFVEGSFIAFVGLDLLGSEPDARALAPVPSYCGTPTDADAVNSRTVWGCQFSPRGVNRTDEIVLHAVPVCHEPPYLDRHCGDAGELGQMSQLLRNLAPTSAVKIGRPVEPLSLAPIPGDNADARQWWEEVAEKIERMSAMLRSVPGERHLLYGVAHPDAPGVYGGIGTLNGNSAVSRSSVIRLNAETNVGVLAHEVGHIFGLMHTNTGDPAPPAGTSPPGCYALGRVFPSERGDPAAKYWPYEDLGNWLYSGDQANPKVEVGLDLSRARVRGSSFDDPYPSFEMMSYCTPRWVSPWSYRGMYEALSGPALPPGAALATDENRGLFHDVSGALTDPGVDFRPVFVVDALETVDEVAGPYRIEVRGSTGGVLVSKAVTPVVSSAETDTGEIRSQPHFHTRVPYQPDAASIVLVDSASNELGALQIVGAAPSVQITFPAGGETLGGVNDITWNVTDPDSTSHTSWVEYSADAGSNWVPLTMSHATTALPVDFARLTGADGAGLIRVYASDGVNSGAATSGAFSVSKKMPRAEVLSPEAGAVLHVGEALVLEGVANDPDDGALNGSALAWQISDLGSPGTGDSVDLGVLDDTFLGDRVITLTATDSDGSVSTDSVSVSVAPQVAVVYPDADPVADANGDREGVEGAPLEFWSSGSYASDTTPLTYAWDFGDGGTATDENPAHPYADDGTYPVTLSVTDQQGRTATTLAQAVISNVAPAVEGGPPVAGAKETPVSLEASFSDSGLSDGPWSVSWDFADGSPVAEHTVEAQGAIGTSHVYLTGGTFPATVTVRDKDQGTGFAVVLVTIPYSSPMEASGAGDLGLTPNGGSSLAITYTPACGATDHVIYWGTAGPNPIGSGGLTWTDAACAMGAGGSADFDPGTPPAGTAVYFVIVGHNEVHEGSYGKDSSGVERPEAVGIGACDHPQTLPQTCE